MSYIFCPNTFYNFWRRGEDRNLPLVDLPEISQAAIMGSTVVWWSHASEWLIPGARLLQNHYEEKGVRYCQPTSLIDFIDYRNHILPFAGLVILTL